MIVAPGSFLVSGLLVFGVILCSVFNQIRDVSYRTEPSVLSQK